jgi:hypothetical protein
LDITLKINADYEAASKAFKELANSSEETREKMEKFSSSFQSEKIDKFTDKQKLLTASLTGTRGEVAAMESAQKNYEKEIERLIRSGLDPESDAIQRLRNEHDKLEDKIKETNEVQKAQEQVMKNAEKAALGMIAVIGASVVAMGAVVQKTAEAGDEYAKTSRIIGMTAETFQELDYAAKMSGVNNLKGSLEKLNKSVADVKGGTGTLTAYLKENDKQLLSQVKNVNSNEEAFNLLMDALNKASDEFTRAELAQAAFGKSGQELILLANEGANGIANLRDEARKYGIISEEAARNSEAYHDAQSRLKSAIQVVGNEITENMLPGLTDTINGIADFIANIDDWEGKLNFTKAALAGTAAALATFVAVSKGAQIVQQMAVAIKALQAAVTGPAGIAAIAVGALAMAIGSLVVNMKPQETQGERIVSTLNEQRQKSDELVSAYKRLNSEKTIDTNLTNQILSIYPELTGVIEANKTTIEELIEARDKLANQKVYDEAKTFIDKMIDITGQYNAAKTALEGYMPTTPGPMVTGRSETATITAEARAQAEQVIYEYKQLQENADTILASIGKQFDPSRGIIDSVEAANEKAEKILEEKIRELGKKISQRLSEIPLTSEQQLNDSINQIKSYLNQRADLEKAEGEARIKSYQDELERIKASDKITDEEKIASEQAVSEAIIEVRKQLTDELKKQNEIQAKEEEQRQKEEAQKRKEAAEKEKNFVVNTLAGMGETKAQALLNEKNMFESFLSGRLEAQALAYEEERLTYLEEQRDLLLEKFKENKNEQLAIQKAYDDMLLAEEERTEQEERKILEKRLGAFVSFFSGWGSLLETAEEHNIAAAIGARALASAEAAINSYLAFTKALASSAPPFNYIVAAGVLASGLAQQIKIIGTPIPSAETGGRFIVPNGVGSDSQIMRVNPGEEVDVTPRGQVGNSATQNIVVQLDRQVLFDVMNEGIRSGDVLIQAVNF